jgi:hypothetical protein
MKRLDAVRTMPQRWPMQDLRKRSYMSTERELVTPFNLQDEDNTARLSDLITLAETGLQAEEDEDDTGRQSELITIADAGF